jgi:hypothetical protein
MKFRKVVTNGREIDVISDVRWAATGERGIIVDGLFIVAPDPSRTEASDRLGMRMRELVASREAPNMHQALARALEEDPDAARAYHAQ